MNANVDAMFLASGLVPSPIISCLQSVIFDRVIEIWGAGAELYNRELSGAAEVRSAGSEVGKVSEILLCPDAERVLEFLASPAAAAALQAGATVIAWSSAPLSVELPASYSACYSQRPMAGILLRDSRFAKSQVAVFHEAIEAPSAPLYLCLWSNEPPPELRVGFFEFHSASTSPTAVSIQVAGLGPTDDREIALTKRLLDVEDRTMDLRAEILRHKESVGDNNNPAQSRNWFDVPRTRHEWPLAAEANPNKPLLLYDYRPDDPALRESKRGMEFFATHGLEGNAPDFAGAVDALNMLTRGIRVENDKPDVSIVIPVYGQLSYTLNCIHSLLLHESRYSVEIIIVDDCSPDNVTAKYVPQTADIRYHRQIVNGGFIMSCNMGGQISRGKYIILLNNDTRVVEGWLDRILESFDLFPRAGLIGSKMLYPSGELQEAGCILWRDGSAWNYGRDDDPNRPQYCYARQVDYISGCSVVLRADLWRQLNGFDPYYAPAYAEDADLCQRVKACGLEVWFQAASRVIHYEGKTSGTQTSGGVKAYQVLNLRKLFLRWRSTLETHRRNGEAPFFEKERCVRKRILFVDAVTPTPDQDAGSVQTVLGLRCAQRAGYKAHFVPENNWLFDPKYTPRMQCEGVECFYAPFDVGFENFIRRYRDMFDVVMVYRISIMRECLPLIREYAPGAMALFHLADLHYLRMQRQAELEQSEPLAAAAREMKALEIETIIQSDGVISHSTIEAEMISAEAPGVLVTVWPLMMEVVGTDKDFYARSDLCFLGGYRHPPNVDAVLYFVSEVLPLLHAVEPKLRFIIAGANPPPEITALAGEGIVVTGLVENLADVFDGSRVFVCPLRVGAGAKGKVVSALAHGIPVVSTGIGVEGAGLVDGEHVLVADEPEAMAEVILRLYHDPILWRRLSEAGLSLVEEKFSLAMGAEKLEEAIEKGYRKRLGVLDA